MSSEYSHIFLHDKNAKIPFTSPKNVRSNSEKGPPRNRQAHSAKLKEEWAAIWAKAKEQKAARTAVAMPSVDGVYVEFEGAPGYELITKSLEDRRAGIRLLNIYNIPSDNHPRQQITRATVFIPTGKHTQFLKKIDDYESKTTEKGNPKHAALIQSVEHIRLAVMESFWRDDLDLQPQDTMAVWCEIWLQGTDEPVAIRFREIAKSLKIDMKDRLLRFPERTVLLGKPSRNQLIALIESNPDIAEFRRAKETARFFLELNNKEQTEWVNELRSRMQVTEKTKVAVCILDTGANNGHMLLQPLLMDTDCHAVNPSWGTNDHQGHGTLMCGVAAFGDLANALQQTQQISINHCLESVKILPPKGANQPDLYGEITIQAISRAVIQSPNRNRIGCMAITSEDGRDKGRPSSWSAAIDQLTYGLENQEKLLFFVSAGNVEDNKEWNNYPESNLTHSIHDPGQSWNALTIGAYTEKANLSDPDLRDYAPLAQPGELSPFSSTSLTWDESKWPIKPDMVLEGGNLAKTPGFISLCDDLSLLSTGHRPIVRQLDLTSATSAATAQAAWMAAQIQARYPKAWPETIRGLMIHSTTWPQAIVRQFLKKSSRGSRAKSDYKKLLRICGFGVPNLSTALSSASNSLTLISEAEIQPYEYKGKEARGVTKDMHLHVLPWPRDVLLELGEMPITLRITLSYFIEPGPGEIGWKDKYRYASHGLRFDLNNTSEDKERFLKRLNKAAREEGESSESDSGSERWTIGAHGRNTGSIQSDIWKGTAADVASCNIVGVYPVIGWWRERSWLGCVNNRTRYALIVSLHTPNEHIDIFTPVATLLEIPKVEVEIT